MQMRLAPLSTRTKTVRVEVTRLDSLSRRFQIETPLWNSDDGVMEIYRRPLPNANAFFRLYISIAKLPAVALLSPAGVRHCHTFATHFDTL